MVNYYPYPCSVLQFPSDSIKLLTILTRLHLSSSPWVDLTICWICITLSELNIHNKHLLFQINTIVLWLTAYERGGVKSVIKSRKSCPMWLRLSCLALTPQIVRGSVHTKSTICDASTFHAMHDLLWVFFAGKVSKFASFHSFIRNGNYYIDTHSLDQLGRITISTHIETNLISEMCAFALAVQYGLVDLRRSTTM